MPIRRPNTFLPNFLSNLFSGNSTILLAPQGAPSQSSAFAPSSFLLEQKSAAHRRVLARRQTAVGCRELTLLEAGFTLIEVLVAIAIVGILAVIAVPQYLDFTRRATFTELVQAAGPIRQSVEIAVQTRGITALTELDSGAVGIPAVITASAGTAASTGTPAVVGNHGSAVVDGVITMTWRDDGTTLDGVTYTLTPSGVVPPIAWTPGGTCVDLNMC